MNLLKSSATRRMLHKVNFKRTKAGLISEFSFSYSSCLTNAIVWDKKQMDSCLEVRKLHVCNFLIFYVYI